MSDREARRQLAQLLSYQPERREAALSHYRLLLETAPAEEPGLVTEASELLHWMGRHGEATRLLNSLPEQAPRARASLLLQARIENALGRAGRARDILEGLRPLQGRQERLQYADALIRSGALHRAEAIPRDLLAQQPDDGDLRLRLGDLLKAQGRYYEAEHQYARLLAERPGDEAVLERLEGLAADAGFRLGAAGPPAASGEPLATPPLARYAAEPSREQEVEADPDGGGTGADPQAEEESPSGKAEAQIALELLQEAERLAEQGEIQRAETSARQALRHEPALTPARYLHAELLMALDELAAARSTLEALAARFPDATKARLELARLASWQGDFDRSRRLYDELAEAYPGDPTFAWEAARVAWWAGDHRNALRRYEALLGPPADARTAEETEPGGRLRRDDPPFAALGDRLSERDQPIARHPDYPRYALQKAVYLEGRAKALVRERRPRRALATLQRSAAFQPGNQEALFDKAQVECTLDLCDRERRTYQQLLEREPLHGQARRALGLLERQRAARAGLHTEHRSESGREASLEITGYGLYGSLPIGARGRGKVAVDRLTYTFDDGSAGPARTRGRRLRGTLTGVASPRLRWRAELAHTRLDAAKARNGTEGRAQAEYHPRDRWRIVTALARKRVLRNARTAGERLYRRQAELAVDHYPDQHIDLASRAELADYSDGNGGHLLQLQPRVRLTEHPRRLTVGATLQHRDTDSTEVDYWTPQDYLAGGLLLEWHHDLAEVFACRALEHHYQLRLAPYADSEGNDGARLAAAYVWDATDHLRLSGDAFLERSSDWDTEGARLSATWYFH